MQLRYIQGGATPASLRGLLIARGLFSASSEPSAGLLDACAELRPAYLTRVPAAGRMRAALDARGVRVYRLEASGLRPDTAYRVVLSAGERREVFHTRTLPARLPASGLSVAVASCYYDGFHHGSSLYNALTTLHRDHLMPAFQIWTGDNLYVDVPSASASQRALEDTLDRYLQYFLDSDYAQARSCTPSFTICDDHELWNNYPYAVPWLSRSWDDQWQAYRAAGLECLQLFQTGINPPGGPGYFELSLPPLSCFFLDTRAFRVRTNHEQLIAEQAWPALRAWVAALSGPAVLVIGQPIWSRAGSWLDYNLPAYQRDYRELWSLLRRAAYDVLVIAGDVHHSRVLSITFSGAPERKVYELVASPACHIPTELSIIGLGNAQGRGSLDEVPAATDHAGQALSAKYLFGTSSPNSFALLTFRPLGSDEVRVGVSFVEHHPRDRYAPAQPIAALPRLGRSYSECHEPSFCVLRQR